MNTPAHAFVSQLSLNYFDFVVVVWLVVGVLRGRKLGMSQELFVLLKWIGIVVVAGLYYGLLAGVLRQNGFNQYQANLMSYLVFALLIHLIFSGLKTAFGEKLVSTDFFGRCEYYFGMVSGGIRFACMVIVLLALMHAKIISKAELAANEKMQKENFEDIRLPTYGTVQQAVLVQSLTGKEVQAHLGMLLISSTNAPVAPTKKADKKPK